jgi:ribosomal protein S21
MNAEVILDSKKSTNKEYFDKKWNKFVREVRRSGIIEEVRIRRCYYKPSARKKALKEYSKLKWKFYTDAD